MSITLRRAVPADAASLAGIYRPYVENTAITLEFDPPDADEFARRIVSIAGEYPYLIAEENGIAIGYAYAHRFKERYGYRFCAELSVYLDPSVTGQGLGTRLYRALIALLGAMGCRNLYGVVTDPNPASFALHQSLGFAETGREHLAGNKYGTWRDVVIFELLLGPHTSEPDPAHHRDKPLRFDELDEGLVDGILKK